MITRSTLQDYICIKSYTSSQVFLLPRVLYICRAEIHHILHGMPSQRPPETQRTRQSGYCGAGKLPDALKNVHDKAWCNTERTCY